MKVLIIPQSGRCSVVVSPVNLALDQCFSDVTLVNDELKGEGIGKNQKLAKEMAAREAWVAMGWGQCR